MECMMYIFILNGSFDNLLDMSLEDAENYITRRISACGLTPYFRFVYEHNGIRISYGLRRYGKIHSSTTILCELEPTTVSDDDWAEGRNKDEFMQWQRFIEEAKANDDDYYEWTLKNECN